MKYLYYFVFVLGLGFIGTGTTGLVSLACNNSDKCVELKEEKIYSKSRLHFINFSINTSFESGCSEDDYCKEASYLGSKMVKSFSSIYDVTHETYTHEKSTAENLTKAIDSIPKDTDFLVIYIGSHGSILEGSYEMMFADGSFRGADLFNRLRNLNIPVLLIFDTCHSGAFVRDFDTLPNNISFIAACSADHGSYSWVLTHALDNGLNGGADYDRNREVTVRELQLYCILNVRRFQKHSHHPQEVIHWGESHLSLSKF